MKDESTIITCSLDNLPEDETTWDRFDAMTDEEIDYSDDQPTDFAFWEGAEIVIPESQQLVQLCIDKDVLDWFKERSEDLTHINMILRDYVEVHRSAENDCAEVKPQAISRLPKSQSLRKSK